MEALEPQLRLQAFLLWTSQVNIGARFSLGKSVEVEANKAKRLAAEKL